MRRDEARTPINFTRTTHRCGALHPVVVCGKTVAPSVRQGQICAPEQPSENSQEIVPLDPSRQPRVCRFFGTGGTGCSAGGAGGGGTHMGYDRGSCRFRQVWGVKIWAQQFGFLFFSPSLMTMSPRPVTNKSVRTLWLSVSIKRIEVIVRRDVHGRLSNTTML